MTDVINPQNPEIVPPAPVVKPVPAPQPQPEEKTSFSLEYVQELRAENAKYRHKAKDESDRAEQATTAAQKAQQEAEQRIASATKAANDRIIRAELKAEAIKAGMVDLDGLKLADLSAVTLDEKGDVVGAEALMAALKESKPYLFGEKQLSTTNPQPAPPKVDPKPFNAKTATPEEIAAEARRRGLSIKVS